MTKTVFVVGLVVTYFTEIGQLQQI